MTTLSNLSNHLLLFPLNKDILRQYLFSMSSNTPFPQLSPQRILFKKVGNTF